MEAIEYYEESQKGKSAINDGDTLAMQRCAEKIWNALSKYVTIDKDGIFKDPDWPHLWDKKCN